MKNILLCVVSALSLITLEASAQTITGASSLTVSNASSEIALPGASATARYAVIWPASGGTASEIHYNLGAAGVAATLSSPVLLPGGECINIGPFSHLAGISASGSSTVRVKMMTACPQGMGFSGGSGGGTSGGATEAKQDVGNASLATIATNSGTPIPAGSNTIGGVTISGQSATDIGTIAANSSTPIPAGTNTIGSVKATDGTNVLTNSAIGDTTAGQFGNVSMAGAVSAAPSNTTAKTYPLYEDLNGNLRVTSPLVTGIIGAATAPTNMLMAGGVYNLSLPTLANGQSAALQMDTSGRLLINVNSSLGQVTSAGGAGSSTSIQAGGVYNTTPPTLTNTQGAAIQLDVNGNQKVALTIANAANSATNGVYTNLLQGNAVNSVTNPVFARITDATTGITIKAASTASVVGDASLVVQNNPTQFGGKAVTASWPTNIVSQYPVNATTTTPTPKASISAGTTGAVTANLAAVASVTNYLCNFDVSAIGGTAAVGPVTITGLLGGTLTYQMSSSAAGTTLSRTFTPCLAASAANTAITITTTADGTATAVDVDISGYQL